MCYTWSKINFDEEHKKESVMARVNPFYSETGTVHHVCSKCTLGDNIGQGNKKKGKGGKPLCSQCSDRVKRGDC